MSSLSDTTTSTPHPPPPDQPNAAEATARETFPAPQAVASPTMPAPVVVPDSAGAATPGKPTELTLSSPGVSAFRLADGNVKIAARNWADSAIVRLGASVNDAEREAIRQEAIRVAAFAQALGTENAEKLAQEIIMRVNRAMGLANPRRRAGRPKRGDDNSDPVLDRGSSNLPGKSRGAPADGRANEATAENRPTGRTISAPSSSGDETSGDKALPAGRELSRSTRAEYRKDAEALSDEGFERLAQAVRDTPDAEPMTRRLVRKAGELEQAGGDPSRVVGVPLPSPKANKGSRAKGRDARPDDEARGGIAVGNAVPGDEARQDTEAPADASARRIAPDLHCAPVRDLSTSIAAGSVDAVVTTLSDRAAAVAVRDLAAHALRPGGLLVGLVVPERLCDVMPSIAGGELGYRWTSAVLTTEPRDVPAAHVRGGRCVIAVVCTRVGADPQPVTEAESPRPLAELLAAWVTSHGVVCDPCCGDGPVLAAALERGFRCIGATADEPELERVRQSLSISANGETPGQSPSTSRSWRLWSRRMKQ